MINVDIATLGLFGKFSGHIQNTRMFSQHADMIRRSRYGKKLNPPCGMLSTSLNQQLLSDASSGLPGSTDWYSLLVLLMARFNTFREKVMTPGVKYHSQDMMEESMQSAGALQQSHLCLVTNMCQLKYQMVLKKVEPLPCHQRDLSPEE